MHGLVLVLGEDFGEDLVDAEVAATASATWRASPVIIATSMPSSRRSATACSGFGADLVFEGERRHDLVAADQVQHGGAALAPGVDVARPGRLGPGGSALAQERGTADGVGDAVDRGFDAAAGERPEPGRLRRAAVFAGRGDEGPGKGVFAVGLDAAGQAKRVADADGVGPWRCR